MSYFWCCPIGMIKTVWIFLVKRSASFLPAADPIFMFAGLELQFTSLMVVICFCFVYLFALGFTVIKHCIQLCHVVALILSE